VHCSHPEPIAACPHDERFAIQISERHALLLRETMIFWNGQYIGFFEENPTLEFGGIVIDDG
jgi:hypothetical protein